ncbi:MAG: Fur family transcriptional regulator [Solirubrobacteraceae bacterium]|jgi:Fur family ferric uptake transcriptional regulator
MREKRLEIAGVTVARARPSWAEQAAQALSDAGHRRGSARRAILELLDAQACALSAVEIGEALSRRGRDVSRASVYRVMEELEEIGFLQRVEIGQGTVRYEALRQGAGHHHHLVCDRCGRLEPFTDEALERALRRVSERLRPRGASEHEIVIHGACERCAGAR